MRHCGVAVLEKGWAIPCGLHLALTHLGGSESINFILTKYRVLAHKLFNVTYGRCTELCQLPGRKHNDLQTIQSAMLAAMIHLQYPNTPFHLFLLLLSRPNPLKQGAVRRKWPFTLVNDCNAALAYLRSFFIIRNISNPQTYSFEAQCKVPTHRQRSKVRRIKYLVINRPSLYSQYKKISS